MMLVLFFLLVELCGIVLISKDLNKLINRYGKLLLMKFLKQESNILNSLVKSFSDTLSVTLSAQLILTPIMLYYFNALSLFSILSNMIVAPVTGVITVLGFIVFILSKVYFPVAKFFSNSLYLLSKFTILIAEYFSKIPFASIYIVTPNLIEIIFFYFIVFYLLGKTNILDRKKAVRFISESKSKPSKKLIGIALILFISGEIIYYNFPRSYLDIRVIDVGQGDAIFIETNTRRKILIDGGGSETYDVGSNILLPYLLDMRVTYIDMIFSSHADADHLDGIITVLENIKVGKIVIAKNAKGYEEVFEIANMKNIDVIEVEKGDLIKVDDVIFEIIWPDKNFSQDDVNEYSLVFKMIYGNKSMLFTGDIGEIIEKKLNGVKADILKVGHHGSKHSTSDLFLSKVKPVLSVIGVGKNNNHGHPNKDVVKKLGETSKVFTTAECGEIKIKMYKDDLKVGILMDVPKVQ